jgi:NitT/TauT family transport system substrate-binding protein
MKGLFWSGVTFAFALVLSCTPATPTQQLRLGYFPNITHSQALIGVARGDFQAALGSVALKAQLFNAGPSVIEALFSGQIDVAYIGPNPAINGYIKSKGVALRIVAGATSGGASLVVRANRMIGFPESLRGAKLASPQLGNTQDVALRVFLKSNQIEASVLPPENSVMFDAFRKGELDGAWVPEPWASRLIVEAGAVRAVDERSLWPDASFPSAVVVASTAFLKNHPDRVKTFLKAHREITAWEQANPEAAMTLTNQALQTLTGKPLSDPVIQLAWSQMRPDDSLNRAALDKSAVDAASLGYLKADVDIEGLVEPWE